MVRSEVNRARALFYESARKDFQVKGEPLPDEEAFELRLRRIRADQLEQEPADCSAVWRTPIVVK